MPVPKKLDRVGKVFETKRCGEVEIISYKDANNIIVKFLDTGYETNAQYTQLVRGTLKDPNIPTISNIGYIGVGRYQSKQPCGILHTEEYSVWSGILDRVYSEKFRFRKYADVYAGCSVAKEWHNFQNFAKWYCSQPNYGRGYHLDKDLLFPGNREYSEKNCVLVPQEVNKLFVGSIKRGNQRKTPVGVHMCKSSGKYKASVSMGELDNHGKEKTTHLGYFTTMEEAFLAYKEAKEVRVKEVAQRFKETLDERVYNNLMGYDMKFSLKGEIYAQ